MSSVRVFIIMMCITFSFARLASGAEDAADSSRKRLDDLFRWRVSDTLQLDTKQETQFNAILAKVHDKRRKAGEEMSRLVGEIEKNTAAKDTDKKKMESLISQYEKQMKIYSDTQADELNELRKVFGTEKLGRYLVFKNELGRKLKTALSSAKPSDATPTLAPGANGGTAVGTATGGTKEKLPEPSIIDNE